MTITNKKRTVLLIVLLLLIAVCVFSAFTLQTPTASAATTTSEITYVFEGNDGEHFRDDGYDNAMEIGFYLSSADVNNPYFSVYAFTAFNGASSLDCFIWFEGTTGPTTSTSASVARNMSDVGYVSFTTDMSYLEGEIPLSALASLPNNTSVNVYFGVCAIRGNISEWESIGVIGTITKYVTVEQPLPVAPTKTGYTFTGWYTDQACTQKYELEYITDNITLYAGFRPNTYTIQFGPGRHTEATGSTASISMTYDQTKALPSCGFSWPGYTFLGWDLDEDNQSPTYEAGQSVCNLTAVDGATITLEAIWSVNSYTVKFNGNGSTSGSMSNQSFTYDSTQALTANAFKRAYTVTYNYNGNGSTNSTATATATFNGWATSASGAKVYDDKQSVSNLATSGTFNLYANWTLGKVTLPTPTRTGYTFAGWYTAASGGEKVGAGGASYTPSKAITLYAQWTPNTYTIQFGPGRAINATGSTASLSMTYDQTKDLPSCGFSWPGYTFLGWDLDEDNQSPTYTAGQSVSNLTATNGATVTLEAIWEPNTYTVKFNGNGATSGSMSNQSFTYDAPKALTANTYKRAYVVTYNYNGNGASDTTATANSTFNGWATSATGAVVHTDKKTVSNLATSGTVNLYANWTLGSVTLPTPTRIGYTFKGWYTASSGGTLVGAGGASYTPESTVTLYAQWTPNTYTIEFKPGRVTEATGSTASMTMTYDQAKALPSCGFVAPGYRFLGWDLDEDNQSPTYTAGQSVSNLTATNGATVTLEAIWEPLYYYVAFEANGGLGTMSNEEMMVAVEKPLPANTFTRTGYTFSGWAESATGSVKYADKAVVVDLASEGNTKTLYAVWTPNTYTIKFDANGGTGTMADLSMRYNASKALTANTFVRAGYNFLGWSTSSSATVALYKDGASVVNLNSTNNGSVTLYAVWVKAEYTVKFDANGGTGTMADQIHCEDIALALTSNAFKLDGYTFVGWSTDKAATSATYTDGQSVKDLGVQGDTITLYAIWKATNYTVVFRGNGNTGGSTATQTFTYDKAQALTANGFTKTGYHFVGWATSASGSKVYSDKQSVTNIAGTSASVTLYAIWEANEYTVVFNNNDGTNTTSTQEFEYDSKEYLDKKELTREGYHFMGWSTSKDGKTSYVDGAPVINLTSTNDGTVTLYAVWSPIQCTVTFIVDGEVYAVVTVDWGTPVSEVIASDVNALFYVPDESAILPNLSRPTSKYAYVGLKLAKH